MPMTVTQAHDAAMASLPESGAMLFDEWITSCVEQGIEREVLRSWPRWKAQGEIVTYVQNTDHGLEHMIKRGGE